METPMLIWFTDNQLIPLNWIPPCPLFLASAK